LDRRFADAHLVQAVVAPAWRRIARVAGLSRERVRQIVRIG
jgi:hypothetical protein